MTRFKLFVGVAAASLLVSSAAAFAQDAPTSPAAAPEAAVPVQQSAVQQPATQQQAVQECSGLGCLFGARQDSQPQDSQPQPQPQSAPEAQPGSAPADTRAGSDPSAPTDAAAAADPATSAPKKVVKPVHVVTIAADATEVARLQRLAAALPKARIRIIKSRGETDRAGSDFSVATALSPSGSGVQTKLFTEQMHIVAGGAIHALTDLQGKVVSFGPDGSPSQAAARKAFVALNIRVKETPLDLDNALDGLATGDVDAVVLLAPQPIDRLATISAPGVHLVSWPEGGALPDGATAATIDIAAYPRLAKPGETIRAMGVDATLTLSARGAKQVAARSFLKVLSQHSEALTKRGFDLLKADLDSRKGRRLASADHERLQ